MTEDKKVTEKGVISSISGSGGSSATTFRSSWATATRYAKNQQVTHNGDLFISTIGHTSESANEPGVGASWADCWARQVDMLTASQIAAAIGEGTPSDSNRFVTKAYVDLTSLCITATAGESLVKYDVVYAKNDGKYWKADADTSITTADAVGVVLSDSASANGNVLIQTKPGFITTVASFTPHASIFLGNSGAIVETATTKAYTKPLGYVESAYLIFWNPQIGWENDIPFSPLSVDQILALDGTGTPCAIYPYVTEDTFDVHVDDATKHRIINDSGTSVTQLWSANKTNTAIAAGMTGVFSFESPVIDKDLSTPPSPVEGARYIVKPTGLLAWDAHDNAIAQYTTDAWAFTAATAGMACHVTDESLLYLFNGTVWQPVDSYVVATVEPGEVDYDAGTVGVSAKLAKEDHNHDLGSHLHESSEVRLDSLGQITHTLEDFIHLQSAGRITGGVITDDGSGGVNISEMDGWLRVSDTELDHLNFVVIAASNIPSTDFTDNTLNYVCADYNNGTPEFYTTTNRAGVSENTQIIIGRIYKAGNDITIFNGGMNLQNYLRINHDRLVKRGFERMSGAEIYETGTRCLGLTAGVYYFGMNKITIVAKDTSVADKYTAHRRDGSGGWTKVLNKTDINNTQYDDGTGLPAAVLPDGTYAVKWIYVDLLGALHAVDGQGYYALAEAKVVEVPTVLPTYITTFCKLAAKIIILKGASSFELIVSGYESALFGTTSPTNHEGLAGMLGGASAEHYHLTNAQHTALTTNIVETVQDIAGAMVDGGTETGLSLIYSDETGKISGSVTYGTTSDTACEGDDARLSDARTPSSHTIASHTTSGAADGKILTASSATEFGWEDPAPTWTQVTSKPVTFAPIVGTEATDAAAGNHEHNYSDLNSIPSTFAPIVGTGAADACAGNDARLSDARTPTSHTIASHTTSGSAQGKVLTSTSATEFSWQYPAPTWAEIVGVPTTFAPIIGSGATEAVAGNDSRLSDSRTPISHTHPSTELTDYTAPTTWNPVTVWSGVAPVYTAVARYTKVGKLVTFWLAITGADGDGRKLTSVTLPLEPKNVGMTISCAGQTAAPTTRSDPYAYIVANTGTAANKLLLFYTALTFGNNTAFTMNVTGSYEVA